MVASLLTALVIAILVIIIAFQNSVLVTVSFLKWQFTGSLALVLLIAFAIGVIVSLLITLPSLIKRGLKASGERKQTEKSQKENSELKSKVEELKEKEDQSQT